MSRDPKSKDPPTYPNEAWVIMCHTDLISVWLNRKAAATECIRLNREHKVLGFHLSPALPLIPPAVPNRDPTKP